MISLLIADDNKNFDINLFNSIKKINCKINVIGISINGLDAYEKIKSLKPDVILLDVKMPLLNGFQVIEKLISEKIDMPKVILITAHYECLSSYNHINSIYGILLKPLDYDNLAKYLDSIISEINNDKINNEIIKFLSNFDFNIKSRGYIYLVECIKACICYPELMNNFEKKLYPYVSNCFLNVNSSKIKWTVEKSINSMYRYTDKTILTEFFPNLKKLSPKYFIEIVISYIK